MARLNNKTMRHTPSHATGIFGVACTLKALGSIPAPFRKYTCQRGQAGRGTVLAFPEATLKEPGPLSPRTFVAPAPVM